VEIEDTSSVVDRLRSEGYQVSTSYVQWLLRDRIISSPVKGPGGVLMWRPVEVARLRAELARRERGPVHAALSSQASEARGEQKQ